MVQLYHIHSSVSNFSLRGEKMTTDEKLNYINKIRVQNLVEKIDELIEMFKGEKESIVREALVDALKVLKSENSLNKIIELFRSDDIYIRNAATVILAAYREASIPYLAKALEDENEHVRKLALDTLYMIREPYVVDILAKGLEDSTLNNLISTIEYMGELEGYKYTDNIAEILKEAEDPFLVVTCLETLSKIGNRYSFEVIKEKFSEPSNLNDFILPAFMKALSKYASAELLPLILEILDKNGEIFYKELIDILEKIIERKSEFSESVIQMIYQVLVKLYSLPIPSMNKYELLNLIGELNFKNSKNFLLNCLNSGDLFVKIGTLEAIEKLKIKDQEIIEKLERILKTETNEDLKVVAKEVLDSMKKR